MSPTLKQRPFSFDGRLSENTGNGRVAMNSRLTMRANAQGLSVEFGETRESVRYVSAGTSFVRAVDFVALKFQRVVRHVRGMSKHGVVEGCEEGDVNFGFSDACGVVAAGLMPSVAHGCQATARIGAGLRELPCSNSPVLHGCPVRRGAARPLP